MTSNTNFDVIIIGGSYAGLSAGMSLGRALKNVLIIDSGKPCNIETPHSHNFITQDGKKPKEVATLAKQQVEQYETVKFYNGLATSGKKTTNGFEITTQINDKFTAKKLIFATGVKDQIPDINGFSECWGISVIHCPYCHGYEYKNEKTGILANGDMAFETAKMIQNWTNYLTVFTNGKSTLTIEQTEKLEKHNIKIIETEIDSLHHTKGRLESIEFKDKTSLKITALYAKPKFVQHCNIPEQLGCELTEHNLIKTDLFQKTTQEGIFVCGDNTTMLRAISNAVAMGTLAGVMASREIIEEEF
ncbi:NAD(P)/FAD-dependent oxidoreductase [Flavobacterium psychroterrae]|uniref:NAD(P)/FAD-dependent oxidoreductase n=1 Tax=Flavobacterium psychroterrae TaxID=2133767 RepID=A0ABS5PDS5_9FLAO|nr:NAD(P)/FAD-dependent oxidoreductase [Flavobacterium psychroterrae]MBS7232443.1 NAD(P)/FAD-dependent oxidoreductase [Flavobacterium psychroterrae]